MIERYIDVDGYWGILFCYDYDRYDYGRMSSIMDSFGLSEYKIIEAMEVLKKKNTGMTISRSDLTMSVMFVSPATSYRQFIDTIAHELDHVQYAICRHYGVGQGSEDAAWLQGYLARQFSPIMCDN
jgi:hypothetical protein